MKIRMKVEGGDKLARKLQMLAEETAREHMRESALEGAELIRTKAVENAEAMRKSGTLAGDIQKEVAKQTKSRVAIHIGPGKEGWYGRLVEEGHAVVRNKKVIGHAPPHPFLRPAFDEKVSEAQDVIAAELRRRLKL
jgi:HK97 gp10 family phage protein